MDFSEYSVSRYDGAMRYLPFGMRELARKLIKRDRDEAEEIRLRIGRCPTVLLPEGEIPISINTVTRQELEIVLEMATQASAHFARESVKYGYVTVQGGYRIGLCGTALIRDGEVTGFKTLSSVAIRVSREIKGVSAGMIPELVKDGQFGSTLIISRPGGGKTTFLRDVVRTLSDGDISLGIPGMRISLADERNEVSAVYAGVPQMDVGSRTDILDSCPKAEAVMMLIRSMNPQVIALDEITAQADIEAVVQAANCGIKLLATAHAENLSDLASRPLYKKLLDMAVFDNVIIINPTKSGREYKTIKLKEVFR